MHPHHKNTQPNTTKNSRPLSLPFQFQPPYPPLTPPLRVVCYSTPCLRRRPRLHLLRSPRPEAPLLVAKRRVGQWRSGWRPWLVERPVEVAAAEPESANRSDRARRWAIPVDNAHRGYMHSNRSAGAHEVVSKL